MQSVQLRYLNERFEIDHRSGNEETASSKDPQSEQCTDACFGRAPRHLVDVNADTSLSYHRRLQHTQHSTCVASLVMRCEMLLAGRCPKTVFSYVVDEVNWEFRYESFMNVFYSDKISKISKIQKSELFNNSVLGHTSFENCRNLRCWRTKNSCAKTLRFHTDRNRIIYNCLKKPTKFSRLLRK